MLIITDSQHMKNSNLQELAMLWAVLFTTTYSKVKKDLKSEQQLLVYRAADAKIFPKRK